MNDASNPPLNPGAGEAPGLPPPGERLAGARREQNLTAADVARQLKLSVWQVEALEAGRFEQLPGPVFVRGFIRNYARLVRLDAEALLRAANDQLPQSAPRPELPPSRDIPFPREERPRWGAPAALVVLIVMALGVYEFYWNEAEVVVSRPPAMEAASAPQVEAPQPEALPAALAMAATEPTARDGVPAEAEPAAGASALRRVGFVFHEESWVEIRDRDDRVLLSQLNRAGTRQQVDGLPPLQIVVGNSHGVSMTVDGEPVDLARHTKIDVARMTLP